MSGSADLVDIFTRGTRSRSGCDVVSSQLGEHGLIATSLRKVAGGQEGAVGTWEVEQWARQCDNAWREGRQRERRYWGNFRALRSKSLPHYVRSVLVWQEP